MFTVDRKQGDIDVTVDHRLLTEEGRKDIKEDVERTKMIGEAVVETASKDSVGLMGDKEEGVSSFLDLLNTKNKYFDATKDFLTAKGNGEFTTAINDPNATPEQKQAAYQALTNHIAAKFGIDPADVKLADIGQKGAFVDQAIRGQAP
ncbi:tautomerase family protein [Vibrio sp. DW001]|uniref:hypothetical protein n=1 Tax=Vibrio sp. DW001 TaxID=2912315 RepID=UPI0023B200C9|nr:hypothetical protein [Vibrio sp. DW001]WED25512.1 tautomerase family protein [Vibrio sp. DW001]